MALASHSPPRVPLALRSPGAYDPYTQQEIAARASFTHNRMRKAFGSGAARKLDLQLTGDGVPGPGMYRAADAAKKTQPAVDHNASVFRSGLPQRPGADTSAPSPGAYTPNMQSVYRNVRDGGASMRGTLTRLAVMQHPDHFGGDKSQTEEGIGPGAYNDHLHNSVSTQLQKRLARSSKTRPAFGTTSAQRELPHGTRDDSPGPGAYQPVVWAGPYVPSRSKALQARSRSAPRVRSTASSGASTAR